MSWLTPRRLRDYPRLFALALWGAYGLEVLFHQGWRGGLGGIIGSDFITLYGAGLLYRESAARLYDFAAQAGVQAALIAPTPYPGLNPFISPPYVAMACGLLTFLPLLPAFLLWNGLTALWTLHAARMLWRIVPLDAKASGLSFAQMAILMLSFFPFLAGWRVGQNHGLTLWLATGVLMAQRAGRPMLAGLLAGLLLYKPQFVLGFLILWLAWGEICALLGFGAIAAAWIGLSLGTVGSAPYREYLAHGAFLLSLPWTEGFPAFALITPYGLLGTLLPPDARPWLRATAPALLIATGLGLALLARSLRGQPFERQAPAWMLALLYPLLASPYALLHDLMLMIPLLGLWAAYHPSRRLLQVTVGVYLSGLFLPLLGALTGLALPALLPISTLLALSREGWFPLFRGAHRKPPARS
ncbi:glycosyltransferase 87 family protein [Thermoflexus sp.]|uniref:glycosyltransferase 87 family protein n=1 Tax=Thermoflexus sp. TaxID=1969742 RepID=UPI00262E9867|nr:glycosyltransferase 87 family protein [Thermoflexus sp.]MCX7691114.1 glycosyltransferase 87 family protein [Thermoflexus sp.]